MQLTEIKNDLATINYSPEINRIVLSDFILIEDSNQSILAQVISIEATMEDDVNSAMLKFLLSIDKDANLTQYTGYVPAKSASLILINPQEVIQLIKGNDKNIHVGNLAAYQEVPVELSIDFLRKKPYIQVDFVENKLHIVEDILKGLEKYNKKTLLFDFMGLYKGISLPTVTLGYNFKLPLNYDALCYIAEEELDDCSNDNKALIQGILIEVQNYVKTAPDNFIPFDTLISVLDAQYEESPMPELLLLKNKLLKYQQQGLFAQEKSEFDFLDTFLKDAKNFKFDLSELPISWHKIAFTSILNLINTKCYMISDFSDENSSKSIIKKLYEKTEIRPIVISSYSYKYQLQLKALSKNLILFKPIQKVNDFAGYTSFLNILSQDNFIIWGEQTLFIPLILKLQSSYKNDVQISSQIKKEKVKSQKEISKVTEITEVEQELPLVNQDEGQQSSNEIDDFNFEDITPETIQEGNDISFDGNMSEFDSIENYNPNQVNQVAEQQIEEKNIDSVEDKSEAEFEEIVEDVSEDEIVQEEIPQEIIETQINDQPSSEDMEFFFDESDLTEPEETPVENVNNSETTVDDLENIDFENEFSEVEESQPQAQNVEIPQQEPVSNEVVVPQPQQTEPETTVDDSQSTLETEQVSPVPVVQNEQVAELNTPSVPVYTSNVAPQIDTKFAQGTYVHHPRFGRGVVEKVINYGSKNLCSIIFDNVGRRLLDPNMAELKQI